MLKVVRPRAYPWVTTIRAIHNFCRTGSRDYVGFGHNGGAVYKDDPLLPFPAIRFRENDALICMLRQKEQGDWKCLSCEEKKLLYRYSFCCTYAEFQHFTGSWKFHVGWALICTSFGFWAMTFFHHFIQEPLPEHISDPEAQAAQLRRMLELHVNPVDGLSSKWDYANDQWK